MGLNTFFTINMPYGIQKNDKNEWVAFNREYAPIGWNEYLKEGGANLTEKESTSHLPIKTSYKSIDRVILKYSNMYDNLVQRNNKGEIDTLFFYDDGTKPTINKKYWDAYTDKLFIFTSLNVNK